MKEKLSKINCSLSIFIIYGIKCLIMPASINDAIIMLGLIGLYSYDRFLSTRRHLNLTQEMINEINNIKGAVNTLKMDRAVRRESPDAQTKRYF